MSISGINPMTPYLATYFFMVFVIFDLNISHVKVLLLTKH